MSLPKAMLLALGAILAGCAASPPKTADASGPDIAAEVARICALPPAEREKALEKLKQDSGMVLFCGSKE